MTILTNEERVASVEESFVEMVAALEGVDEAKPYKDELRLPTSIFMYFDWEEEVAATMSGPTRAQWEWVIELYVSGTERQAMQTTMKRLILQITHSLRQEFRGGGGRLGGSLKKMPRLANMSRITPVRIDNTPYLHKMFRLIAEREVL